MSVIVEEIDDSAMVLPPSALPLGLPEDLAEWVDKNRDLIIRVQEALTDSYAALSEEEIRNCILAATGDPEFLEAHKEMQEAEKDWNKHNHPMHAPLGLIGLAMESDKTINAREQYHATLASFTIISEGLMERRPDLAKLLNVLLVQKRMLDQSLKRTRQVKEAARELADLLSLREIFGSAAKRPSLVSRQFQASMRRLLLPKRQFNAKGVTFPWAPGL